MAILYRSILPLMLLMLGASCTRTNHQASKIPQAAYTQQEKNVNFADAILREDLDAIKFWIEQGIDINRIFLWYYHTPLTYTVVQCSISDNQNFYYNLFSILTANKHIQLNATTSSNKTPLMCAAEHGNLNIMKDLLKLNANPTIIDKDGNNALSLLYARYYMKSQLSDQLAEAGGCISNALFQELQEYEAMIKLLIQHMTNNMHDKEIKRRSIRKIIDQVLDNYGNNLIKITSQIE